MSNKIMEQPTKAFSHYKEYIFQNYFDNHFTGEKTRLGKSFDSGQSAKNAGSKNFQADASVSGHSLKRSCKW